LSVAVTTFRTGEPEVGRATGAAGSGEVESGHLSSRTPGARRPPPVPVSVATYKAEPPAGFR
jgi:hypothetical protein